jgi:hypothetical protein
VLPILRLAGYAKKFPGNSFHSSFSRHFDFLPIGKYFHFPLSSLCVIKKTIAMKNIPLYLPALFIVTTLLTLYFLYRASRNRKTVLVIAVSWLALQAAIGLSGFYLLENTLPPRFALTIIPPMVLITTCFLSQKGKLFLDSFDAKWLTILQVVRVPVEFVLFGLFVEKYVPELMTFEGRNFDIISGLTAPLVFYFGYVKPKLNRRWPLAWNFVCLALLISIVVNAILSAPFSFQQFAFDQPNIAIFYFPFVWLPAFIVPTVLFSHLVSIRQLISQKQGETSLVKSRTAFASSL